MSDFYCCVMFPYPSGSGLHIGHYYNYAVMDSYCRWLRYKGDTVFQPFGYDAFGLPAENYARSINGDPAEVTRDNIVNFRRQMEEMNTEFTEKLVTSDPSYYKWTQWLFTELHNRGLAYKATGTNNYCPSCETVLANEQVKEARCDRCACLVTRRTMDQWYFKITDYKDRLIAGLDSVDYPKSTKIQQRNWLANLHDWCVSRQRSWGCPIPIEGETDTLDTFVDSSFYYLRYLTDSDTEFLPVGDYKQVDLYVGGQEHACMHLIYARFIHMFLYDIGMVPEPEPFKRVIHQGMITRNGAKMGKSAGNALNPDDFNQDELRFYLMFIGHYFDGGDWNDRGIIGITRFFNRMRGWLVNAAEVGDVLDLDELDRKVDEYVKSFKFNRVVSTFMEFYNKNKSKSPSKSDADQIIKMLQVFVPGFSMES